MLTALPAITSSERLLRALPFLPSSLLLPLPTYAPFVFLAALLDSVPLNTYMCLLSSVLNAITLLRLINILNTCALIGFVYQH